MSYTAIIFAKKEHVAYVTINRPEANNVVNQQMAQEIKEVCRQVNLDDEIYVVVLTATGDVFCAGSELEPGERKFSPTAAIASVDRPVIAAINGDAIGGGLEIALCCDIRIASDKACFGLPQVAHGAIPINGGTQRLARIVGKGKALEMLFTAEYINAGEALEIGLVSKVIPGERLADEAETLARTLAAKGPIALRYVKEAVNKGTDMTLKKSSGLEVMLKKPMRNSAGFTQWWKKNSRRNSGKEDWNF